MDDIELSERSGVPYYRQIQDQIAEAIRAGRLAGETRLPSVRELAAELLVSAITVRRAYAELEAAGLIARHQGKGTFVAPRGDRQAAQRSHEVARQRLAVAVAEARQLGLSDTDVRTVVEQQLSREGES